ncbi:hypothetical protein D3C84_927570 [compost metagenome]
MFKEQADVSLTFPTPHWPPSIDRPLAFGVRADDAGAGMECTGHRIAALGVFLPERGIRDRFFHPFAGLVGGRVGGEAAHFLEAEEHGAVLADVRYLLALGDPHQALNHLVQLHLGREHDAELVFLQALVFFLLKTATLLIAAS